MSPRLVLYAARLVAGRRFWIAPLLPLAWPVLQVLFVAMRSRSGTFSAAEAQGAMIGLPLVMLGIGLGVRIIAGEIDRRTLEIAYTVPGGTHRVWTAKLIACVLLLVAAAIPLALVTWVFFTEFPPGALYGALQAAIFYTVLAMAFSALTKSEAAGALITVVVLVLNGLFTGFGQNQIRISPFWNPEVLAGDDPAQVLAWTVQNRIGFILIIAAVIALAFGRAEQRERVLSG
jgi:ABC-type transport system involved in multi-copper enzyme maturation permease subunit